MKIAIDKRFQVLYHWNERTQMYNWGAIDSKTDSVHCGVSVSQLDLFAEAIEQMKCWRKIK